MHATKLKFALFALFLSTVNYAQCRQDYAEQVDKIVAASAEKHPTKERVVFAGSSTFRLWEDLHDHFPAYEVVNAGIGGSCFMDLNRYREQLISGTEPDALIIYEGDNDAVNIEEIADILEEAESLYAWIREHHPDLPVFQLSPKPSPLRWSYLLKYMRLNSALETLGKKYNVTYIDCWPALTLPDGRVNEEYFIWDRLHLNEEGNKALGDCIRAELSARWLSEGKTSTLDDFVDGWHRAASVADSAAYFGAFATDQSIFQGTDATEYWTAAEFRTWAARFFRRDEAWTFVPVERHWYHREGAFWFSERLNSEHMGLCRGTGVLVETASGWKIDHYSLSFEVPNEVVDELVPVAQPSYVEAKKFQKELNDFYSNPEDSPLNAEERAAFEGHEFYPINANFRVEATLELTPDAEPFDMATSSGQSRKYRTYAIAHFELDGQPFALEIYQSLRLMSMPEYEDHLFLPFTDRTSGVETYGTGRFMDLERPHEGTTLLLDFNLAYNPYCAYTDGYSCPITPSQNFVDAAIQAGIKGPAKH